MREFKMSKEKAMLSLRKRMVFVIPLVLLAEIIGSYSGIYNNNNNNNDSSIFVILSVIFLIIIISFTSYSGFKQGNKINNDAINSYKLEISEDIIKMHQKNIAQLEINRAEIASIVETLNKGITIKTESPNKYIFIPISVEGYNELREILSGWKEIGVREKSNSQLIKIIVSLVTIISFGTFILSYNKYIVTPVGIVLLLGIIWGLYKIVINQYIDSRIKKKIWFIVFPFLFILAKIIIILKID